MSKKKTKAPAITKEWLENELKTKSPYVIAHELGTYPNRIRRTALKLGVTVPNHSQAQKIALESGRAEHPTEGRERSKEEKDKIARGVYDAYQNMPDDKKAEISEKHKQIWDGFSDVTKESIKSAAAKGVRKAAEEGSKTEKFLKEALPAAGYTIEYHKTGLLGNPKLEIDILLPTLKTIIEINGISHYEPIHGEDVLKKKQAADAQKYGLLISGGYCVIVVKHLVKNVSGTYHNLLLEKIVKVLEQIAKKFPGTGDRLIEVEV